tara:strand:- start:836 stop:1204 length:369 start_codon:yes stop_codon:yes gene_type:complete
MRVEKVRGTRKMPATKGRFRLPQPLEVRLQINLNVPEQVMDDGKLTDAAREKLRLTVERIERLEEEKKEVADQIKDVYAEAKAMGYDTKALRQVVRLRKQDRQEREEAEAVLETYLIALGEV